MRPFKWTTKREKAALALAQGYTVKKSAEQAGVNRSTVERWKKVLDFSLEVDRLTLLTGIATRSERLRIAKKAVRQKTKEDGTVRTGKDLLDWLKFAQSETDGAKFDLASIFEAMERAESNRQTDLGSDAASNNTDGDTTTV